jgi:hypothetical protein
VSTIQEQFVAQMAGVAAAHPIIAPQGTALPYVTYQRISSNVNNVLSGPPSIDNTRLQVDVWAGNYAAVQTLAAAVKARMLAWSVQNVLLIEYDLYEQDVQVFRVLLDYSIWQ